MVSRAPAQVVYEWARGLPFKDICGITGVDEGLIVRTVTRLDETCREVRTAWSARWFPLLWWLLGKGLFFSVRLSGHAC
jgi:hypothetical protein